MSTALKGYEGSVTTKIGAGTATAVGKVTKWTANVEFKEIEGGPYIGSTTGDVEVQVAGRSLKGKLEMDIPEGRDAQQTATLTQALAGGEIDLALVETDGYTITSPVRVSNVGFDNDGAGVGKMTFDFRNSGAFTIAATA